MDPQYTLQQNVRRVIVPKILLLLFLVCIFYLFMLVNVWLLKELRLIRMNPPTVLYVFVALILFLFAGIQFLIDIRKLHKQSYQFFPGYLTYTGEKSFTVQFLEVESTRIRRESLFDKMFGTGTILINGKYKLYGIGHVDEVHTYLQQLIQQQKAYYKPRYIGYQAVA